MIRFAIETGGPKNARLVVKYFQELSNQLKIYDEKPYCHQIEQFILIFRVSGEVKTYGFEGFEKLRLEKKRKRISVEYGFSENFFFGKSEMEIKRILIEITWLTIQQFFEKLAKEKIDCNQDELISDFESVKKIFLAETEN